MGGDRRAVTVVVAACVAVVASLPASAQAPGPDVCSIDVMFVLDRSTSMDGDQAVTARAGAVALVRQLSSTDQSGLRSFPETLEDKGLTSNHAATEAAMSATPVGYAGQPTTGWAANAQNVAISDAHADIEAEGRPDAYRVIVAISDGQTIDSRAAASAAKEDGIRIFSVAVGGEGVDEDHMKDIASQPKSVHFHVATTAGEAEDIMESVRAVVGACGIEPAFADEPLCAPGPVRLTDLSGSSAGDIVDRRWTFGDGAGASVHIPEVVHAYDEPGAYEVRLVVTTSTGARNSVARTVILPACPPEAPHASFACRRDGGQEFMMRFTDTSREGEAAIVAWDWTFGDGGSSHTQHPSHEYAAEAAYLVRLTVWDAHGQTGETMRLCDPRNQPPTLGVADVTVWEGRRVDVWARGSDPDGDLLHYRYHDLPPGATVDGGRLTWSTRIGDAGLYQLGATVEDGRAVAAATFQIEVLPRPIALYDADRDGVPDQADPCPATAARSGGTGSCSGAAPPAPPVRAVGVALASAADLDRDGVPDAGDNCPAVPNRDQGDQDQDGRGDVCDDDADGDRVPDDRDNCPAVPNAGQEDRDADGRGDVCRPGSAASSPPRAAAATGQAVPSPAAAAGQADAGPLLALAVGVGMGLSWCLLLVWVAQAGRRRRR